MHTQGVPAESLRKPGWRAGAREDPGQAGRGRHAGVSEDSTPCRAGVEWPHLVTPW